jgi:hypothetical protein
VLVKGLMRLSGAKLGRGKVEKAWWLGYEWRCKGADCWIAGGGKSCRKALLKLYRNFFFFKFFFFFFFGLVIYLCIIS